MEAIIACPRCQRKLRSRPAWAGDVARCPACEATFDVPGNAAPDAADGTCATPVSFITTTRPLPPRTEAETQHSPAPRSNPFRGGWPKGRVALAWLMAALALDLIVLALNLTAWGIGLVEPDAISLDWDSWGKPTSFGGLWVLLCTATCIAIALSYCLSYLNLQARGAVAVIGAVLIIVCGLRLLMGMIFAEDTRSAGDYSELGPAALWPAWWFWANLPVRWCMELLMLLFLAFLAWDWQHEETFSRLRWVGAWLIIEFVFQMAALWGGLTECHSFLMRQYQLDTTQAGAIVCAPMLVVRLAVMVQLFRALLASRRALADPADVCEPSPDA
jgi:hypothetical protein